MRKFRGIVQTNIEPKDENILWYNNKELLFFNNGEWQPFIDIKKLLEDINKGENNMTKEEILEIIKEYLPILPGNQTGSIVSSTNKGARVGKYSITIGEGQASGDYAVSIGDSARATGSASIAIGYNCNALNEEAIAIGIDCDATGVLSFAYGDGCTASNNLSFAIGESCTANSKYSYALGKGSQAGATNSAALGKGVQALIENSFNCGAYNVSEDYIFTIGNGINNNSRHNAFAVDDDGYCFIVDTDAEGDKFDKPMINIQNGLEKRISLGTIALDTIPLVEYEGQDSLSGEIKAYGVTDYPSSVKIKLLSLFFNSSMILHLKNISGGSLLGATNEFIYEGPEIISSDNKFIIKCKLFSLENNKVKYQLYRLKVE